MKNRIYVFFAFLVAQSLSLQVYATTFECQTFLNLEVIASDVVEMRPLGQKTKANSTSIADSFLIEKAGRNFTLEVYLPQHEMRVYSEASLSDDDSTKIEAGVWARDGIIDVSCRLLR